MILAKRVEKINDEKVNHDSRLFKRDFWHNKKPLSKHDFFFLVTIHDSSFFTRQKTDAIQTLRREGSNWSLLYICSGGPLGLCFIILIVPPWGTQQAGKI